MTRLLIWLALLPLTALAQYPDKPVRIIVPYAAGAMGDVVSRVLAEELRPRLGQPVIVDARPGAGGNIGTAAVVQASPDGYTVLVAATNNLVINQFLYPNLGFDPLEALAPVTLLVDVPSVVFTSGQIPAKTFPEFAQFAKTNRGKLNYGSPGAGSTPHLSAELINRSRGLGLSHIPYKGASQAITALLANEVHMYLAGAGLGAQHVRAGKIYAVAVSSSKRLDALPDTPTFQEAGLADIKASNWWGAAVPKGSPASVVRRLNDAFRGALASSAAQEQFKKLGVIPIDDTPEGTLRRLREESEFWSKAVKEMNVRID
jgi:tripartite-type tricarboxylate transporter receptor subunit TctC